MKNNTSRYKGILFVLAEGFCFACMSLFLKLSGDLPTFQKSFFRNLVAIFFALGIMIKDHVPFRLENRSGVKYLWARAIGGTVGIFCNFYAVDHMVIADANMLNKLSPFFAMIFSFFLLKEKVKPYQLACVIMALSGSVFILKPSTGLLTSFPALIAILGGMGAGFAYTNVRLASKHGVPGPLIVLFFSVFSCATSIPLMLPVYRHMEPIQLVFLLLAGLSATGGQFSITAAYSHAPAREISVYDYSQIIFAALLGMFFLGEMPDAFSIIGYLIITGAGIILFILNRKNDTI